MEHPIKKCFEVWINRGHSFLKFNEFRDEFNRFILVSRILRKYKNRNMINIRLLLNHVIVLYNIFGKDITPIFFLISEEDIWSEVRTVLDFFKYIPENSLINYEEYEINLNIYPKNSELEFLLNEV